MQQLGELQKSADALRQQADAYVINPDSPESSRRLKQISGISLPVLLDPKLTVGRQYDLLPKSGQPMGGMAGVAQMGFVIVDSGGTIRVQRVDIEFGQHAGQMLEILRLLAQEPAAAPKAS